MKVTLKKVTPQSVDEVELLYYILNFKFYRFSALSRQYESNDRVSEYQIWLIFKI